MPRRGRSPSRFRHCWISELQFHDPPSSSQGRPAGSQAAESGPAAWPAAESSNRPGDQRRAGAMRRHWMPPSLKHHFEPRTGELPPGVNARGDVPEIPWGCARACGDPEGTLPEWRLFLDPEGMYKLSGRPGPEQVAPPMQFPTAHQCQTRSVHTRAHFFSADALLQRRFNHIPGREQ